MDSITADRVSFSSLFLEIYAELTNLPMIIDFLLNSDRCTFHKFVSEDFDFDAPLNKSSEPNVQGPHIELRKYICC